MVGNEQDVFMNYGYIFNDIFATQMTAVYQKQEAGKHTMLSLKTYSAVFFAHPIALVFCSVKPRDCGFESRRSVTCYFFNFPIFKSSIKQLLQHDEINIVQDFGLKK